MAVHFTVHKMCVHPDQRENYLQIDGDISAGALYDQSITLRILGVAGEFNQAYYNQSNRKGIVTSGADK